MTTIEVDFDVFKELTVRRPTEHTTHNDVIRALLNLEPKNESTPEATKASSNGDWFSKGVRFLAGTEFRATYKGVTYHAQVAKGGLVINNSRFTSPSAAAMSITDGPVNGWIFWECRSPGESTWKSIKSYRTYRR